MVKGLENLPGVIEEDRELYPDVDIFTYFTDNIKFVLDDKKKEGLDLFLNLADKLEPVVLLQSQE